MHGIFTWGGVEPLCLGALYLEAGWRESIGWPSVPDLIVPPRWKFCRMDLQLLSSGFFGLFVYYIPLGEGGTLGGVGGPEGPRPSLASQP